MGHFDQYGQPVVRQQLDSILAQGRLPHAILMYGETGSGTLPAALSLANDILCTSPKDGKACGQCTSCHRAEKLIHPDLHFLLPLPGAKSISTEFYEPWREAVTRNPWMNVFQWTQICDAEGKQVDIHKEDILNATSQFNLEAYEGGNKVMIIWMAQYLAREGNRLLKLIEEPQPGSFFILVTNQREQLLSTIRSRCMQVYFPPMQETEIKTLLRDTYNVPEDKADLISRQAVNDMDRALALVQNNLLDYQDEMAAWFRYLLNRKGYELVSWSQKMGAEEKEEQKQFARYVLAFLRRLVEHQPGQEQNEMINWLVKTYTPDTWYSVMEELQATHDKIVRNANTKLLWLSVSIALKNQLAAARHQHINA